MKKLIAILALTATFGLTACNNLNPNKANYNELVSRIERGEALLKECGGKDKRSQGMAMLLGVTTYLESEKRANRITVYEGELLSRADQIIFQWDDSVCEDKSSGVETPNEYAARVESEWRARNNL